MRKPVAVEQPSRWLTATAAWQNHPHLPDVADHHHHRHDGDHDGSNINN